MHNLYDISYLRPFPNLTILYPKDSEELEIMINKTLENISSPIMIMMPYGPISNFGPSDLDNITTPELAIEGEETLIVTLGNKFGEAKEVALKTNSGLLNIRCLKPLQEESLLNIFKKYKKLVIVEEAVRDGGVGSSIVSLLSDHNINLDILRLGVPCTFVEPGSNKELSFKYKLDSDGIIDSIEKRWPK